ncbi:lactonase family protein [Saccharibacillus sp. CPCC 101409]|uniref:lactonase family protein n=1 Tax=Saccharibacillus sp. CPCC 101409 TaxID=3058041 RepID=UPI0026715E1D|nr:lactonase family protein [Saccharibacillus sp. CPCC 101409]MDO3410797.1 lactonase family protein [Saccharibacillus sp. CPCC 101409]
MTESRKMLVFVGSYAEATSSGVYTYEFDETEGALKLLDQSADLQNPTFLNVDVENRHIYAIGEAVTENGKAGEVMMVYFDEEGTMTRFNRTNTTPNTTCHIQRESSNRFLVVSSYHGGMLGLVSLKENGHVGELLDVQKHVGADGAASHVHSAFFSPDEKFLLVQDLGLDLIRTYSLDAEAGRLVAQGDTQAAKGAGPRHLAFHPSGKFAFVINELNSTIASYRYNAEDGSLSEVEVVPTLPHDYAGENGCSEIAVSSDGRFVYGANRGHDSIVVYAFDEQSAQLTLVQHVSTEGRHPRHFALTPSGKHLIAANRDTNNIVVFDVDQESGKLAFNGNSVSVSKPVCVQPFYA